jgi:hypothetical protein
VRPFCQYISDTQVRVVQAFELWGIVVAANTVGVAQGDTVLWTLPEPVDGWRVLAHQLSSFHTALSACYTSASVSALSPHLTQASLLIQLLHRLVEADVALAPLLDAAFAQPSAPDLPSIVCQLLEHAPLFAQASKEALSMFASAFALLHLYGDVARTNTRQTVAEFVAATLAEAGIVGRQSVEAVRFLDEDGISTLPELASAYADPPRWTSLSARLGPAATLLGPALSPRTRSAFPSIFRHLTLGADCRCTPRASTVALRVGTPFSATLAPRLAGGACWPLPHNSSRYQASDCAL